MISKEVHERMSHSRLFVVKALGVLITSERNALLGSHYNISSPFESFILNIGVSLLSNKKSSELCF